MSAFTSLGPHSLDSDNESGSFWPSFTDIMMVIVMIFLFATSLLIIRNWNLVAELQASLEAEKLAEQMIQSTSEENATLEERLTNAEQLNSILRLRLLEKEEQLKKEQQEIAARQQRIQQLEAARARLQDEKTALNQRIESVQQELQQTRSTLETTRSESETLAERLARLETELQQQRDENSATRQQLEQANDRIASLSASNEARQQQIDLLEQEKIDYNRQLLTLKGEYEVVKSKYEELIKPARTAKGKYVAEVYYVKGKQGKVIRFKEPGDATFRNLSLQQVEARLAELKKEKGKELYVKIIIPKDSGLTYNEAWNFMKNLLEKYDYYYQQ